MNQRNHYEDALLLAHKASERAEERLRLSVRLGNLAIAEIDYGTDLIHLAPESAVMFGLPRDTATVPREYIHSLFHHDDRPALLLRIAEAHDPNGAGVMEAEHRIVRPDGTVTWHTVRKQVYFERSGPVAKPQRALLILRDITGRKQAEEALRQNAELFARIVDQAPIGMYVVDAEFRLQQVNAWAAPIFSKIQPLIGRDFRASGTNLWPPEDLHDLGKITSN